MKKMFLLFGLCLLFVSCKTTNIAKTYPDWIRKEPSSKKGIYAVGTANLGEVTLSRKMAEADAVNNLTRKISVDANSVEQIMLSTNGTKTVKGYEENSLQKAHNTINGYEVKDYFVDRKGNNFILVFLPYESKTDNFIDETEEEYNITKLKMDEAYERYFK